MLGKPTIIVIILLVVCTAIALLSYAVLKSIPIVPEYSPEEARMTIAYERAQDLLSKKESDKAAGAFLAIIVTYPGTPYAEKSLRNMAEIYYEREDFNKAHQYYTMLLQSFPEAADADEVRGKLGKMSAKMMASPEVTAGSIEYVVKSGDSLYAIAKRYNTTVNFIKNMNSLQGDVIHVGQKLKINASKFSILVDKSKNILVLKKDGEPFKTYSIATGRDNSTPAGSFTIVEKLIKPAWTKPGVGIVTPDSPEYELGARWMAISEEGYGIHGTHDDSYIGKQTTSGCIRMHNADVIELYDIVPNGTEVEIIEGT